jgi:hypothetical protein
MPPNWICATKTRDAGVQAEKEHQNKDNYARLDDRFSWSCPAGNPNTGNHRAAPVP